MKYMESKEIMDLLKISERTLRRYIKEGMPVIKVSSRKNLYDFEAIEKWLKERTIE